MVERIHDAVLQGDSDSAAALTEQALQSGITPSEILNKGLISAMDIIGDEFESGTIFIPDMLFSAEAMKAAMEVLRPRLVLSGVEPKGKIVIGTVSGDLHDIGKKLIALMLEGQGFEIVDLGVEVTAERFVDAVREHHPDVVAMSALLTTTMLFMPRVIEALAEADLRNTVKIIVGGAPVTREYAAEIGADGYAEDASTAVALVKSLIA